MVKGSVSVYIKKVNEIGLFPFFFSLGLIISPLVFWPSAPVPYEVPRVWFILRWIEVLAVIGVFTFLKRKKRKINIKLLTLVNLFFVIAIITALTGSNFTKSIIGNYYRSDGLITLGHFLLIFYLMALLWEEKWKTTLTKAIAIGSTLVSIWALVGNSPHFPDGVGGSFGQPNFLGGYLLVSMPATFFQIVSSKTKKQKWIWVFFLILQIIGIVTSNSRASILGLPVLFIIFAILQKSKFTKILTLGSIVIFTIISIFFFLQFKNNIIPDRITAEGRSRIFTKAVLGFREKPLLGWGWANFDYLFSSIDWPFKLGNDVYVDKAHSTILEVATTTGVFGLITYILIITEGLVLLYKKDKYFFLIFFLFILHSQTNIISTQEELIFWISLGISARPKLEE